MVKNFHCFVRLLLLQSTQSLHSVAVFLWATHSCMCSKAARSILKPPRLKTGFLRLLTEYPVLVFFHKSAFRCEDTKSYQVSLGSSSTTLCMCGLKTDTLWITHFDRVDVLMLGILPPALSSPHPTLLLLPPISPGSQPTGPMLEWSFYHYC